MTYINHPSVVDERIELEMEPGKHHGRLILHAATTVVLSNLEPGYDAKALEDLSEAARQVLLKHPIDTVRLAAA
jgi:hypothetical protein